MRVDVVFRDVDVVEHWTAEAARGRFEPRRGDVVSTLGHLGRATIETAHAIVCSRGGWVLNEKGLVGRAGFEAVHRRVASATFDVDGLLACVDDVSELLTA